MEQGRGPSERQPLPQALQYGHPYGPAVQHHRHWQRRAAGRGERAGQQHRGRADRRQHDEFRKHRGNRHNKTREINLSHRRAVGDKRICRLR